MYQNSGSQGAGGQHGHTDKGHLPPNFKGFISTGNVLSCASSFSVLMNILSWVQIIQLSELRRAVSKNDQCWEEKASVILGRKSRKIYDVQHSLATTCLPCHLHLAGTTRVPVPSTPATLASVLTSVVLRSDFWPWSMAVLLSGILSLPTSSFSSISNWLRKPLWFCPSGSDPSVICSPYTSPTSLGGPIPAPHFMVGAFDSRPFQPKEPMSSMRAGTMPLKFTAVSPGLVAVPGFLWLFNQYMWNWCKNNET